ncbi:hypothetical protein PFISCL1PPCAC_900, partial [Pristionchus fissidentatus]
MVLVHKSVLLLVRNRVLQTHISHSSYLQRAAADLRFFRDLMQKEEGKKVEKDTPKESRTTKAMKELKEKHAFNVFLAEGLVKSSKEEISNRSEEIKTYSKEILKDTVRAISFSWLLQIFKFYLRSRRVSEKGLDTEEMINDQPPPENSETLYALLSDLRRNIDGLLDPETLTNTVNMLRS